MATYFVTGVTGFIGGRLCARLLSQGEQVVALSRRPVESVWGELRGLRIEQGDLLDAARIENAMRGCDFCIHLAGLARQWSGSRWDFQQTNTEGTRNILEAAVRNNLQKVVFTSTAGVWGPCRKDEILDENSPRSSNGKSDYERSKQDAEQCVLEFVERKGLSACIVNPSRVFGPGLLNESNTVTRIMWLYELGQWRLLPGSGNYIGNYVYVDDVVEGHILALQHGQPGQNYLLSGENLSFRQLFDLMAQHATMPRQLIAVPKSLTMAYAYWQEMVAKTTGAAPRLTPAFARRYFANYVFSHDRARGELGYFPRSASEGISATFQWIRETLAGDQAKIHVQFQ